jgi:amidase
VSIQEPTEITAMTVRQIARAADARSLSAVEIVDAHLKRIGERNPAINALVYVDDETAMERARVIDQMLARGQSPGPLAGVPFTAKDNLETVGIPTTLGVPERADAVPERDATVVERMKAAGAILLGKTNLPPWGGGIETDNALHGRTNNPHDLSRTPGGSSGGEAAAIASGMSPCGLGSDSGGSLRYPAHCCGIATIKPTAGLVPLTGLLDDVGEIGPIRDPRTQVGPLARSVDDLALLLPVLSGPDGHDAGVPPVSAQERATFDLWSLRVAVQVDNGEMPPSADTARVVDSAAGYLAQTGADVRQVALPDEGAALTRSIWHSYGGTVSAGELYAVLHEWDQYRSRLLAWFQDFDIILRPVDARPAPLHGETDTTSLYTLPFSLTGWPCVVVPFGKSGDPLPIGVQIVAHPWRDLLALAVGVDLAEAFGSAGR